MLQSILPTPPITLGSTPLVGGTPGSVLFAGSGGMLSQDNAGLFWNDTLNRLGIGTVAPLHALQVHVASGQTASFTSSTALGAGSGGNIVVAPSTGGVPSAGDQRLGVITFGVVNGVTFHPSSQIRAFSEGAWTETVSHPTQLSFSTTNLGTTTVSERVRISANGNLGIGNSIPQALLDIGTTAATARTRNLFTDASNGEWAYLGSWGLAANVATYGADKNGTGTYRDTQIVAGGANVATFATTGLVTLANSLTVTGVIRSNSTSTPQMFINTAAGNYRTYGMFTTGVLRWQMGSDNVAEGGSNAGSDFAIINYSDAGGFLSNALTIKRSTGNVTIGAELGIAVGKALAFKTGTGARAGDATLVAGTVTVSNTTVTANTKVFTQRKVAGGTIGMSLTYVVNAGSNFVLTSDNTLDTSTYSYWLMELN